MGKSKLRAQLIVGIVFVLTTLICSTPRLGGSVVLIGLIMLTFSTILMESKTVVRKGSMLILLVAAYLFIIFLYRIVGISDAAWGRYAVYTYLELQVLLMLLIPQKLISERAHWVWWSMSVLIGGNILWNCFILHLNPELNAVFDLVDDEILRLMNIGGSDFYVMALLFFNICFFVFLNVKKKAVRFATLFLSVVSGIYVVWFSLKASVVVFWLLSFVFLLVTRRVKRIRKFVVVTSVLSVLVMLVVSIFSDELIKFVVDYSPSERVSKRIVMLVDANNLEANDNSYNARVDLWNSSLYTWLENAESFFVGIGDHWGNRDSGIGQHSEFLDFLAKYGLIGSGIMLAILIESFRFILSLFDKKFHIQLFIIIMVYIFCGITKRVFFSSVGVVFYLLLPLSAMFVNEDKSSFAIKSKIKIKSNIK